MPSKRDRKFDDRKRGYGPLKAKVHHINHAKVIGNNQ